MRRILTVVVAAALLAASLAASAQATLRDKYVDEATWAFTEDCGFPVEVTGTATAMYIVREGKNGDDGAFPVLNRLTYGERWTNPATGEWFVVRGHLLFNEVEATHVAGTIFEFRFVEAGQALVVEDSSGALVERNTGALHVRYLFDTHGDDEPGGDWVADVDLRVAGPHPGLEKH